MTTYAVTPADPGVHKTLAGATVDTVTIDTGGKAARGQIINRSVTGFHFRYDGTAAVVLADGTYYLGPNGVYEWSLGIASAASVSIAGAGEAYSVQAMPDGRW